MLGDEVASYLAGAGLGLSATTAGGTVIFADPFPPTAPDTAVCIIEYGGSGSDDAFGPSLSSPVFEHPRFQLLCRDRPDNALACRTLAHNAKKKLRHFSGTMGTVTYGYVRALGPVFFLKYDENARVHYACNFECTKQESP